MNLKEYLSNWDRKDTEYLSAYQDKNRNTQQLIDLLIKLIEDDDAQSAATWLLKNRYADIEFSTEQSHSILNSLEKLVHWDAQLHILQILDRLHVSTVNKQKLEKFLRKYLVSENKFVRAWSYNGLDILAHHFSEYREEVDQFLAMGLRDEPESVKARIRNILRKKKV